MSDKKVEIVWNADERTLTLKFDSARDNLIIANFKTDRENEFFTNLGDDGLRQIIKKCVSYL